MSGAPAPRRAGESKQAYRLRLARAEARREERRVRAAAEAEARRSLRDQWRLQDYRRKTEAIEAGIREELLRQLHQSDHPLTGVSYSVIPAEGSYMIETIGRWELTRVAAMALHRLEQLCPPPPPEDS